MTDVEKINTYTTLFLGSVGENKFRQQQIDVTAWLSAWPGATVSAVFFRPDGQLYTVAADITSSPLVWTPGAADLAVAGDGKLELRIITADGVVGKSAIISTVTHGSLGAVGDPPTPPAPDWTTTVAENATEARTAATDAQQAAQTASDAQQAINTAEPARVQAEQGRATAESERASAESGRATAESNRETAESGRQTAENNRSTDEQNRGIAETGRVDAENLRKTAETNRGSAEITRGQNESTRQSNESTRQSNESARVSAEQTREAFYNGFSASISELTTKVLEKTSYGVYAGLAVTAQSTPNMTVKVAAGTIYMANGDRFTPAANTALAVTAADATNPRIDIVYVNSSGVIAYLAGTAAASPAIPSVPTGGQLLAQISVAANATTITSTAIADRRKTLTGEALIYPTLINGATQYSSSFPVRYFKDAAGIVHVDGWICATTVNKAMFAFPSEYRVYKASSFNCIGWNGSAFVSVPVLLDTYNGVHQGAAGGLFPQIDPSGFQYISLGGISFRAEA